MSPTKIALSLKEVGEVTGLGRTSLYHEIKEGRLPARKVGRRTLILSDDLEQYLRSRPVAGARVDLTSRVKSTVRT